MEDFISLGKLTKKLLQRMMLMQEWFVYILQTCSIEIRFTRVPNSDKTRVT